MTEQKTFLYLARVLTYGSYHPLKIGVSKNVRRRMMTLSAMGIYNPKLLATFEFETKKRTLSVERAVCMAFPRDYANGWRHREIIKADAAAVIEFIKYFEPVYFSLHSSISPHGVEK